MSSRRHMLAFVLLATAVGRGGPLGAERLLLYLSGDGESLSAARCEPVDGVVGRGFCPLEELRLPAPAGAFPEGTVCFWVKPLDWQRGDGHNHSFLRVHGQTGYLNLFLLYYNMTRLWNGKVGVDSYRPGFERDQWVFLAFTWREDRVALYLNGVPIGTWDRDVAPLTAGDDAVVIIPANPGTAFDEVMLLRGALAPVEVRALYYRACRRPRPVEESRP